MTDDIFPFLISTKQKIGLHTFFNGFLEMNPSKCEMLIFANQLLKVVQEMVLFQIITNFDLFGIKGQTKCSWKDFEEIIPMTTCLFPNSNFQRHLVCLLIPTKLKRYDYQKNKYFIHQLLLNRFQGHFVCPPILIRSKVIII